MAKRRKPRKRQNSIPTLQEVHESEQFDGALHSAIGLIKPYSQSGVLIAHDGDGNWKVLCYAPGKVKDHYEEVIANCINAALQALARGHKEADNWEA